MNHFQSALRVATACVASLLAAGAAAQAPPPPPQGTIASEMAAGARNSSTYGGLIDVTAVDTTLIAFDADGHPVTDLRPDELLVLEDGQRVRLLGLEPGIGPSRAVAAGAESTEAAQPPPAATATVEPTPWRVVVYVSTELAGRFVLHGLCRDTADNAARLTALGPVDVVLADPSPTLVTEAGRRPGDVENALNRLADTTSGSTTIDAIRNAFMRDFKPGVGFDTTYTITQSSPQAVAAKARASIHRERTIIRGELDRMVAWLQSQPPTSRGLLLWMTGGFDLNPSDFYIPLVSQIDSYMAAKMRTDYAALSLEADVRQIVEVALAYGWTVMPLSATHATFAYGADVDGTGKSQHHMGVGAGSVDAQQSEFQQVAPNYPLQIMAGATGGEMVTNENQFESALDLISGAYLVTYQADRPADGRLHHLEIRCTRPGVRLRGRQYAASGSLRGVSTTRARRLLAGEDIAGGLEISAAVVNVSRQSKGFRQGDLRVTARLGELRATLEPLDLGEIRITLVVDLGKASPFISHQEFPVDWTEVHDVWQYSSGFRWPGNAHRVAVVVEELVTSTWGSAIIELD